MAISKLHLTVPSTSQIHHVASAVVLTASQFQLTTGSPGTPTQCREARVVWILQSASVSITSANLLARELTLSIWAGLMATTIRTLLSQEMVERRGFATAILARR